MQYKIYQVDAFTTERFRGNPASVCVLEAWPQDEKLLQRIAAENNQPATTFLVPAGSDNPKGYEVRWFAPFAEIPLCGHGSMAAAHIIFGDLMPEAEEVKLSSPVAVLTVKRAAEGRYSLSLPAREPKPVAAPDLIVRALDKEILEFYEDRNYMAVLADEEAVRTLKPDLQLLAQEKQHGLIVTAKGSTCDCASRMFVAGFGGDEDPVTGSAHCSIIPFWSKRLGKQVLHARQLSARGGEMWGRHEGNKVILEGNVVHYMQGMAQY